MQEEAKPPIELNDKIPQSVNDIIMKAMRKDQSLRYQNATEMLNDLKRALRNPDENFVDNKEYTDMPTQKISLKEIEDEAKRNEKTNKKKNKFKRFISKHKGLTIFISLVLLFFLSLGGTIAYSRLTNPKEVLLPNLVGINIDDAKKTIQESGLELEIEKEEYNNEYAAGYIISQNPMYSDNYNIKMGTKITVIVSKGIEQAIVPKVTGMTEEEAIKALENAKLKYEKVEEESKKVEAGYVISQETEPDTQVFAGDTVVIHISTGTKKVQIPSVIGKTEEDAKKAITSLGLKVNVVNEEDLSKDNGTVLKQSIDAGKEVEEGTNITITVNKITEEKTVNVTVNLKSLLNGNIYETEKLNSDTSTNETNSTDSDEVEKKVKKVDVRITVNDKEINLEKKEYEATETLITNVTGRNTIEIKVFIDNVWVNKQEFKFDLSTKNSISIN